MRAVAYKLAHRMQQAKRAVALAAAIAVTSMCFQMTGEPPRYVTAADGTRYQVQASAITLLGQLAIMVVSALLSYALAPKPPKPKPAALSEFDIPQAKEGQSYSWLFGENYIPDATVGYWGNLTSKPIKAKKSGGKK